MSPGSHPALPTSQGVVRLPRRARALKALREGVKRRLAQHRDAGIGGGERSGGCHDILVLFFFKETGENSVNVL